MGKVVFYRWAMLFLLSVVSAVAAHAQSIALKEEGSFMGNLEVLYQRSVSPTAKATLANFQPIWEGQLGAAEKTKIFNIARNIQLKNPNFLTHIENLLICVTYAVRDRKLPADQQAAMLAMIEATAEDKKYTSEALMRLLTTIKQFLAEGVLYKSVASTVSIPMTAKFSFDYAKSGDKTESAPQAEEWTPQDLPQEQPATEQKSEDPWDDSNWDSNDSGWSNSEFETAPKEVPKRTRPGLQELVFEKPQMPVLGGAFIKIEPTDLTIRTSADTLTIRGTSGNLFIMQTRFIGKDGKTDWTRTGLPADAITCTLSEYHFDVRRPTLTAEYARLSYPAKTDSVVLGVFEYNSQRVAKREKATYPRFKSYYANIPVKDIAKDLEYIGGFSLIGRNFSSANFSNRPSQVFIKKNGELKFRTASRRNFNFTDTTVTNPAAEMVIYLNNGQDSISHPGVRLYYNHGSGKLSAVKERREYDMAPFTDTYHRLEMYADRLRWDVSQDSMILDLTVSNQNVADSNRVILPIRSMDYFSDISYSKEVRMGSSYNPVGVAVAYAKQIKSNGFTVQELANYSKINARNLQQTMRNMDKMGFLSYDDSTGWIELKRKAVLYANASMGLVDYDNLELLSITEFGKNIIINLTTNDLVINGVSIFPLWRPSEPDQYETDPSKRPKSVGKENEFVKEGVWVEPTGGIVKVQKNREIIINGMVEILKRNRIKDRYYGSDFRFNYDGFLVDMPKVDSIVMAQRDSLGRVIMARNPASGKNEPLMMQNKIQAASGVLYVANPKNRSGQLRRYANDTTANRYPEFRAGAGAYIAFEGAQIEGSQSYKDRVKFDMTAFNLRGSDRAAGAERFGGTFKTGGIFPDFEETISQQKDGSFGFVHKTSKGSDKFPKGYPLYTDSLGTAKETTGYFEGEIVLNNGGIRGRGNINYLSAQLNSADFMYYPDSVTTMGEAAKGRPKEHNSGRIIAGEHLGTSYPDVEMNDFQLKWLARQDSMMLSTTDTVKQPFKMYGQSTIAKEQQSTFKGTLTLTPKVLAGDGIIDNKGAIAKSAEFAFMMSRYTARHAEYFKIKVNDNADNPAMLATNVRIDYDLAERRAVIETEVAGEQSFRFPYTKYKTSLARAVWDLDQKQITMTMPDDGTLANSVFTSTDAKRKGLSFNGHLANYNLTTYQLNVKGVPYIFSVDAHIIPNNGDVTVLPEGAIAELENCQITVQAENQYHQLDKGTINVFSKHEYSGSATYHYKNDEGKEFEIPMQFVPSQYGRNSNRDAILTITKTKIFEDQQLIWKAGTIFRGDVTMRGDSVSLIFNGEYRYIDLDNDIWFPAKGVSEITVATVEEVQNQQVGSGIFLNDKSKNIYAIYRSPLQNKNDRPIFGTQNGIEKQEGNMRVTETKGWKENYVGNRFAYGKSKGVAEFEGKMELIKPDARFNILAAAKGRAKYDEDNYSMQALMAIKLEEGKGDIFKDIAKHIKKQVDLDETAIKNDDDLLYKLANLISRSDFEDFQRRITRGRAEISDVLPMPLVLHNVNLNWSADQRAFYSKGKIHLSNIFKENINLIIDGYIEIPMAGKQVCNIYLQVSKGRWYYLSYQGNDIKMVTSDEELNKKIADPKSKDKFKLAEKSERLNFVNTFRQIYLNQGPMEDAASDDEETIEKDGDK